MKKTLSMSAVLAGIAAGANPSSGVELNAEGIGHVLIYPYYTVNAGQQTLISVVNSTDVAKMVIVHFREAHDSRDVWDFTMFLSAYDVWTASIFAVSDAGLGGEFAAMTTNDSNCISPDPSTWTGTLPGRRPYQQFLNFSYIGTNSDTGPTSNSRTREGHIEVIELADLAAGSTYARAVTHVDGVPTDCAAVQNISSADPSLLVPSGGILGAAAIVNVGSGTFFSYNADALAGFTERVLVTGLATVQDELGHANSDVSRPGFASAFVFDQGRMIESIYPTVPADQRIDAVSAVFMADAVLNEYNIEPAAGANTDWVVTFPTKRFYVDPQKIGATAPAIAPFVFRFGQAATGNGAGRSCTKTTLMVMDREERGQAAAPFFPPDPSQIPSDLCLATNIMTFVESPTPPAVSAVLASAIARHVSPIFDAGWMRLDLDPVTEGHAMRPDTNGNVYHGLPVTGFEAVNYINSNVSAGVLANYSGAFRHRTTRTCTNTTSCFSAPAQPR